MQLLQKEVFRHDKSSGSKINGRLGRSGNKLERKLQATKHLKQSGRWEMIIIIMLCRLHKTCTNLHRSAVQWWFNRTRRTPPDPGRCQRYQHKNLGVTTGGRLAEPFGLLAGWEARTESRHDGTRSDVIMYRDCTLCSSTGAAPKKELLFCCRILLRLLW